MMKEFFEWLDEVQDKVVFGFTVWVIGFLMGLWVMGGLS